MGRVKDKALFQIIHDYFQVYLPNQRGASSHTIRAYRMALEQLLEYVAIQKNIDMSEITFDMLNCQMINQYLDWLTLEKKCCPSTRNHRLACIRSFFRYASRNNAEYIIYQADIDKIPKQKEEPYSSMNYMNEDAIQTILKQPDTRTKKGIRDQFFMILMYDSAARIQEMLDLRICDIRLGNTPTATLLGKGKKIRSVPLMPETIQHFHNYKKLYHPKETMYSEELLFYVERKGVKQPMSDDNVRKFLKKYGELAQKRCPSVPDNIHPHLWRHSRAMHLYQHGMALSLISQWLGHSNLETTLIYAYADTEQKRKAIEKSMGRTIIAGIDIPKYKVNDKELLKKLYGLK